MELIGYLDSTKPSFIRFLLASANEPINSVSNSIYFSLCIHTFSAFEKAWVSKSKTHFDVQWSVGIKSILSVFWVLE